MQAPPEHLRVPLVAYLHDTALHDPITALSNTAQLHEMIHDARALAITQARRLGYSWPAIAAALEQSTSTVHRRFSILDRSG